MQPRAKKGRQLTQIRPLVCERGLLNRADGSAKWSQGGTSVLVAVYGPRQASERKQDAEKAVIEVVFKPSSGLAGDADRGREFTIRRTVEGVVQAALHPRTSIQVVLQVLQDDGALLSASLNATCAALLDAGIPMATMFASVTCALSRQGGSLLVDPDAAEEQSAQAVLSIAFPYNHDLAASSAGPAVVSEDVLSCDSSGKFTPKQFLDICDVCRQGCSKVAEVARQSLVKSFQNLVQQSQLAQTPDTAALAPAVVGT